MHTAKLFSNGRSQAVRLPAQFRFRGKEVFIKQVGNALILFPRSGGWGALELALRSFEPGFRIERAEPAPSPRRALRR